MINNQGNRLDDLKKIEFTAEKRGDLSREIEKIVNLTCSKEFLFNDQQKRLSGKINRGMET